MWDSANISQGRDTRPWSHLPSAGASVGDGCSLLCTSKARVCRKGWTVSPVQAGSCGVQGEAVAKPARCSAVLHSSTNLPGSWKAKGNPQLPHRRCPAAGFGVPLVGPIPHGASTFPHRCADRGLGQAPGGTPGPLPRRRQHHGLSPAPPPGAAPAQPRGRPAIGARPAGALPPPRRPPSPQPDPAAAPRSLRQVPPALARHRSVQQLAEPPEQRLRQAAEGQGPRRAPHRLRHRPAPASPAAASYRPARGGAPARKDAPSAAAAEHLRRGEARPGVAGLKPGPARRCPVRRASGGAGRGMAGRSARLRCSRVVGWRVMRFPALP